MAGQVWGTDNLGGYMYSDSLSHELRLTLQPVLKFRQFADVKDATHQGLNKGDTFNWNVYSDIATAGTTLTEGTNIPESNFTITQASMTVDEYGNSVPYSGKLDNLSLHPVREIVRKVLKNDAKKALDLAAATQFALTPLRAVGDAGATVFYTDGTPLVDNDIALGTAHVKDIVDYMKERNIPAFMGDDYYAMAWPTTFRAFKDDLEALHKYVETGFQFIMNGEIGRYEGTRFVEQTNIVKGGSIMGTPAGAWTAGVSDWAVFFGEDTVAEAIVVPEEIRGKIPGDYGRNRGVAWYYLGGFGIVHPDDSGTNINARVVLWDSKA